MNSKTLPIVRSMFTFLPRAIRRMTEGYIFSLSTFWGWGSQVPVSDPGGSRSQIFGGGVPGLRFWGGTQSQIFRGGYLVSDFWGGIPGLRFSGGGGTWSQ